MPRIPSRVAKQAAASTTLPREDGPWTDKVIAVLMNGEDKPRKVQAKVYGGIAVHQDLKVTAHWAVTSITTGSRLIRVSTQETALQIGEALWDRACLSLREKTEDGIKAKLPEWVEPWLKTCAELDEYLDPSSVAD